MTVTWVSVTSGSASTGRRLKAAMPPPMKSSVPSATKSGMLSARETRRRIMARCGDRVRLLLDAPRLQDLLQHQRPIGDHFLAVVQSVADLHRTLLLVADPDLAAGVPPAAAVDEHETLFPLEEHRARGQLHLHRRLAEELRGHEHLGLQFAMRVVQAAANPDRPRARVEEIGDRIDARG